MSKEKIVLIGSAGFLALLNKADDKTDVNALFQQSINELAEAEQKIIVFTANMQESNNLIAELKKQLTLSSGLQAQLDNANDIVSQLRIEMRDINEEFSALQYVYDKLQSNGGDTSGLQAELSEAYEQIAELGRQLDLQAKTRGQDGILVQVGEGHKMLIGKHFTIKRQKYTAQQVADSPDLLHHLHQTGSGSLVEPAVDTQD